MFEEEETLIFLSKNMREFVINPDRLQPPPGDKTSLVKSLQLASIGFPTDL